MRKKSPNQRVRFLFKSGSVSSLLEKMERIRRLSKILGSTAKYMPQESLVSKSQKLFNENGLTYVNSGKIILMPLLMKSLAKLKALVRKEMEEISAFEFSLPILASSNLFKKSGRLDLADIFKVYSERNHKTYVLSPTCEEAATELVKSMHCLGQTDLPLRFYQISTKFRNEMRPRSGLMRSKEFLMKDLYCFDASDESCEESYQQVLKQYHHLFDCLNVPYVCAEASTGEIGGLKSHEFHFFSDAGQDKVVLCQNCGHNVNLEIIEDKNDVKCEKCQSANVIIKLSIEVGHTFKLGTKYTDIFKATYGTKDSNNILHMSSFGLGLTRILGACTEVLSSSEAIRWPVALAPYLVCILPPKAGSKEEKAAPELSKLIYNDLHKYLKDEVVMDDRISLTLGNRILLDKRIGFPFQVVIGKNILDDPPKVEVIDVNLGSTTLLQIPDVNQYIIDRVFNICNSQSQREKITV